ncbi:uncharacterized protein LOC131164612 [Malania oleifera]|uniref:uncharacterized protein LOC131164612 n=1 Tax=Malania oleifera TaxID=397392 RepID=UPI0025ADD5D6|nr:uncharacterized protein LOC131164612 [Malania oleifera]
MDPTAGVEAAGSPGPRSEDFEGSEKRPAENGNDGDGPARKKARGGSGTAGSMKRVAEIVLVLSAMAEMRGGRSPTAEEMAMMAEARAKAVELCGGLAPKDVVPRDAIGAVIEDLGLNKARDQRLGFRPPKISIAEKLLLTKRKMEESKGFGTHSTTYTSQRPQTSFSALAENRGTSQTVRMFPSDKPSHPPIPSGGLQPALPLGQVSAATSTSLPHQLSSNGLKSSTVSSGLPSSQPGKDPSSLVLPKADKPNFRLEGGLNGTSYALQFRANSSTDHPPAKAPMWSLQPQSAPAGRSGQETKMPDHTSAKVEVTADRSASRVGSQASRDQTTTAFITQATSGSLPHQSLQSMNYAHTSSPFTSHSEIVRFVQKLLQPQLPEHPTWTPPSRDYMNKALTCLICKLTINEVESVLVCDACEKGFHLKCIQPGNLKGIPRGEWHCPRCLMLSNGKALPPKYGRVMRNITPPKISSSTAGVQSPSEKKLVTSEQKVNQQKIIANGNSALHCPLPGTVGSNCTELASDIKMPNASEMQNDIFLSNRQKMDDMLLPSSETCPNNLVSTSGADLPPSGTSDESSSQQIQISDSSTHEKRLVFETKSQPPVKVTDSVVNTLDHSQAAHGLQHVDQKELPNCDEVPLKQCHDNNPIAKDLDKSYVRGTIDCKTTCGQDIVQPSVVGTADVDTGTREDARLSVDGLHTVDWIGNAVQVVGEKTFYQSCFIDGVTYKLQDHALLRSSNAKLTPSKLQAMWEDSKARSKWINVKQCYFPGDLPEVVGHPCTPESDEVYESNRDRTVMAGLIQGPCGVLPPDKFKEEFERRTQLGTEATDVLCPIYLCKWLYDESKGGFVSVSS